MRSTISTVLDFMIDTFCDSPSKLSVPLPSEHSAFISADPPEVRELETPIGSGSARYYHSLVLWNDETHSFNEVIDQVKEAMDISVDEAKAVAETVDFHGRQVLRVSVEPEELFRISRIISSIGLTVSIRSARETFREEIAGVLIDWLKDVSKQVNVSRSHGDSSYQAIASVIQRSICEELFAPRREFKRILVQKLAEIAENGDVNAAGVSIGRDDLAFTPDVDLTSTEMKLRIDHLILSDIKMWKRARNSSRELYIGTMIVSGDDFKKLMGVRFAYSYLPLITNYLLHDREPDLSIINFSVQLFTAFYLSEVLPERFPLKNFHLAAKNAREWTCTRYPKLGCDSQAARSRRDWHLFQDSRYILSAQRLVKGEQKGLGSDSEILDIFLDLLRVWQAMHPQTRYTRQHIEYEQEQWIQAFNLSLQLGRMVHMVAECLMWKEDHTHLCNAAVKTIEILDAWCKAEEQEEVEKVLGQKGHAAGLGVNMNHRVPDSDGCHTVEFISGKPIRSPFFNVASQAVSFHHPLHWFLAYLIGDMMQARWEHPNGLTILEHIFRGSSSMPVSDLRRVSRIMEAPLQTTVLLSQIRAGVWVRNGLTLRAQATHYRSSTLREHYDQDLFLLQTYLVLAGPDMFLTAMLDRYDLAIWFKGNPRGCAGVTGLEDEQIGLLAEDFLEVLITLFSERSRIISLPPSLELKREIIHHLAVSGTHGIAYSDLSGRILDRLVSSVEDFDDVLQTVADFKFPEGTTDSGVYVLKDQNWGDVDPWFWHYTKNQREEVEAHLKTRHKNSSGDWWVPRLETIADTAMGFAKLNRMMQSEVFIHIVFFAIWNVFFGVVRSVTVVNEAVQILALALVAERTTDSGVGNEFSKLVATTEVAILDNVDRLTLLELLIRVLNRENDDDDLKDAIRKIEWITERVGGRGGELAQSLTQAWRATRGGEKQKNIEKAEVNEKKKIDAKAAAMARKAAIMAQFAAAQKKFSEENPVDDSDEDEATDASATKCMDEDAASHEGWDIDDTSMDLDSEPEEQTRLWEYPSGTCIFCQEETAGGSETYGILGLVQPSTVLRCAEVGYDLVPSDIRLDEEIGLYISTCGHLMHLTCFHSYYASIRSRHEAQSNRNHPEDIERNEFLCPLCKTLGNCFVPVLWAAKEEKIVRIKEEVTVDQWWERGLGDFANGLIRGEVGDTEGEILHQFMSAVTPHRGGRETTQSDPTYLYRRLTRTLLAALGSEPHEVRMEGMIEMWDAIAYTVRCLEVTARSKGENLSITEQVPSHALTLLRVLCEGLLTCSAAELRNRGSESRMEERGQELIWSIFSGVMDGEIETVPLTPFLMMDGMDALGEVMFGVGVMKGGDDTFWEWVSVFYVREIVATLISVVEAVGFRGLEVDPGEREEDEEWSAFFKGLTALLKIREDLADKVLDRVGVGHLKRLVSTCILGFSRECVLFGWARCGIVFDTSNIQDEPDEIERLRRCLRLPKINAIVKKHTLETGFNYHLIEGWCQQLHDIDPPYFSSPGHPSLSGPPGAITIRYVRPTTPLYVATCTVRIPALIPLPHRLDTLFEESIRRICKRCKQVPTDPALCLLCGTFVCSQSYCCQEEDKGECHIHSRGCGGDVGIYFIIKKCVIYLMHNDNGCFIHPPYLDSHGEVDVGLRRGRPQYLNQKRYDELSKLWLTHGIPSFVARKIESTFDVGGWITL
ncbi:hypothetical protein PhCBS80983_g04953 [Powellomyces hirtus]|uniref:E3 ubiquitin-protein ligase n=1 Tax=Powellomyces hirtus TaxID=109895 RepID=A0A507DWK7_9FUNG|nr:hypothetical protein PhCBS80983_g04953 [Powellomyces hirtus]